jgi:RTX calcium-binding nonapeptide repeat (4 copies)
MATFRGTSNRDVINGTSLSDFIQSVGGDDEVRGNDGSDTIDGGTGNDLLFGGRGGDFLFGGTGNDTVNGGEGRDIIEGGDGNDQISGGAGNDTLDGGKGDDVIDAGAADDVIDGGEGNNSILGGNGNDQIATGTGSDTIDGGNGNDKINGGSGQDFITTGAGKDVITLDTNLLRTGDIDRSSRQVTAGEDFVTDFTRGKDVIALDAVQFRIFGEINFVNSLAADLPSSGVNFIVLQDSDNDANPATPFNAGSAANLIAAQIEEPGPGFFVYFNSDLNLNRLVYSEDLSDPTADLQVIARFTNETGDDAIAALSQFTAADFDLINEQSASAAPEVVVLEAGGQVFSVDAFDFVDAGAVGVDRDGSFAPGRAEVVDFDPASDVVQIDQALIALDQFIDGAKEDTFFTFTKGISGIGEINSDAQAGEAFANAIVEGSGIALYYDVNDDTVNVALIQALDADAGILNADVIIEFEVDGQAEGFALIDALSPANFQIVSPADLNLL